MQLTVARQRKEAKYHEFLRARRCRLLVLASEVGGRFSEGTADFVNRLAKARARASPQLLRASVRAAYAHRWSGILAVAAQRALAATLLEFPVDDTEGIDGEPPVLEDVLADARTFELPEPSRLM